MPVPLEYYEGFLDFLVERRDAIEVITYADLPWGLGDTYRDNYKAELKRWRARVQQDPDAAAKVYVLIQHDVDSFPELTMDTIRLELERGVRSNSMIFNRQHLRRALQQRGELEFLPYELDVDLLKQAEREGFVIGYHANAYEQAFWDERRARRRFRADVRDLRRNFDIRFFSAHGGVPGPNGTNNVDFEPPRWQRPPRLRWVATGHGVRFHGIYSDGDFFGSAESLAARDLRDFVRTWEPGKRYLVLTHPQYYSRPAKPSPVGAEVEWYAGLFDRSPAEIWHGVEPGTGA